MRIGSVFLACVWLAGPAAAQERRWAIEGYAGVLAAQPASAGTLSLPPAGPPIVTSTPTFPSRAVPSWFFGDGATLLNAVLQEFGAAHRITPLDSMFAPLDSRRVGAFGLRVRRRLEPGTAFEASVDGFAGSPISTGRFGPAVDTSKATFVGAFGDLFSTGPFSPATVVAQGAAVEGRYRETAVTGAVTRDVGRLAGLQPYITIGGGGVFPTGAVFSAHLHGSYTTAILGEVPIAEADAVALHVARSATFAVVAGGGVRRDLSPRWSFRLDARWLIGPDTTRVTVDAAPDVVRATPAGFIESFTNPAIQFSNDPSTGRVSSLSGAPLHGAEVFHGGVIARTIVSAAIAWRF